MSDHTTEPGRPATVTREADGTATQATAPDPLATPTAALGSLNQVQFAMVPSKAAAGCIPNATGAVTITPGAHNDVMTVSVSGLPPNTDFDLFVLEIPDAPFGVAWYQSDLHTDATGSGMVTVQGIFNQETFSLSLGGPQNGSPPGLGLNGPAVNDTNVVFRPTHLYHLGLWFNKPADAVAAGCPGTVTPFNGEQNAGIQVLSTRNFPASNGPLEMVVVRVKDFEFVPKNAMVTAGQTVVWQWEAANHSTTSDTNVWDSKVHNAPFSFTHTFTSADSGKSFPYFCSVHGGPRGAGMSGTVQVM